MRRILWCVGVVSWLLFTSIPLSHAQPTNDTPQELFEAASVFYTARYGPSVADQLVTSDSRFSSTNFPTYDHLYPVLVDTPTQPPSPVPIETLPSTYQRIIQKDTSPLVGGGTSDSDQKGYYTELGSGLFHQDPSGDWKESNRTYMKDMNGRVYYHNRKVPLQFSPDANSIEVIKQSFGKRQVGSAVAAVGYLNTKTDQMALIAFPQNSSAQVMDDGVLYTYAFDAIDADIRYRVQPWGIEQDVLIYGHLPMPAGNPAHTKLCILTEFVGLDSDDVGVDRDGDTLPAESSKASVVLYEQDERGWYRMHNFHRSYAFPVTGNGWTVGGKEHRGARISLQLRIVEIEGKLYLSEELPLSHILYQAPHTVDTDEPVTAEYASLDELTIDARPRRRTHMLAKLKRRPRTTPYVIDYIDYSGSVTNDLRLSSGETYYISDDLVMDGAALYVEPGAIIKIQTNASIKLISDAELATESHALDPAILTTAFDDSIGEAISGITGTPETNRVITSLILESGNQTLTGLDFRYFRTAVEFSALNGDLDLRDSVFQDGKQAVSIEEGDEGITLRNLLFDGIEEGIYAITNDLTLHNLTFNAVTNDAVTVTTGVAQVRLKSSVFNNVGSGLSSNGNVQVTADHNAALTGTTGPLGNDLVTFGSSPFASGTLGDFYISNANLLDAGHTNAHLLGLYHHTSQTSHSPETNSVVDIGYHYPSLDDTDGDGLYDYEEDENGNGVVDSGESDPDDVDTDGDGLDDYEEVRIYFTDPTTTDTDGDGFTDDVELAAGTDPNDDTSVPLTISGTVTYPDGLQSGDIHITATFEDDRVLYLPMDTDNGNDVFDHSYTGNDATVSGATWTSNGIFGGAYSFDGNDYLQLQNDDTLKPTNITVSAWINPSVNYTNGMLGVFITKEQQGSAGGYNLRYNNGSLDFMICQAGQYHSLLYAEDLDSNTWYHIAGTYDGSVHRLYLDGEVVAETNRVITLYHTGTNPRIGATADSTPILHFKGLIDEPMIYSRGLSELDIRNQYHFGAPAYETSLTTPGAYTISNVPPNLAFTVTAFRDSNSNLFEDTPEADGEYDSNPVTLSSSAGNIDIVLADPDTDGDGDSDLSETLYGSDPADSNSFLVSISGIISYDGFQPGDIVIEALRDDGEALHFTFDSDQGSVFTDETGNYSATNSGAIHTTNGYFGGAMVFSNTAYMTVGDVLDMTNAGDRLTVSTWVNTPSNHNENVIIGKYQEPWPYTGWALREVHDNAFVDLIDRYPQRAAYHDEPAIDDSTWHHLTGIFRRDASSLSVELYVDGEATGDHTWNGSLSGSDTIQPLMIGSRGSAGTFAMTGRVDEVWIFERELNETEISLLYSNNTVTMGPVHTNLQTAGAYTIRNLPNLSSYTLTAWKDPNTNLTADAREAYGSYVSNDLYVAVSATNVNITLTDEDSDGDTVADWWEEEHGYDYSSDVTNGLVLWMPLDESSGTNVTDSSGNDLDGELWHSPTPGWTNGPLGGALDLSLQTNDVVVVPNDSRLDIETNLTLSAWVYHSASNSLAYLIDAYGGYFLRTKEQNYAVFKHIGKSPSFLTVSSALDEDQWYNIAATHTETNFSVYIDGVLIGTKVTANPGAGQPNRLGIGGRVLASGDTVQDDLEGMVDDIRIYNTTLSSNAVASLAELGADDDGDGISNFNEYQNRTDPSVNDVTPPVITILHPPTTIEWTP